MKPDTDKRAMRSLRELYNSTLLERIPDDLRRLLDRLS